MPTLRQPDDERFLSSPVGRIHSSPSGGFIRVKLFPLNSHSEREAEIAGNKQDLAQHADPLTTTSAALFKVLAQGREMRLAIQSTPGQLRDLLRRTRPSRGPSRGLPCAGTKESAAEPPHRMISLARRVRTLRVHSSVRTISPSRPHAETDIESNQWHSLRPWLVLRVLSSSRGARRHIATIALLNEYSLSTINAMPLLRVRMCKGLFPGPGGCSRAPVERISPPPSPPVKRNARI